VLGGMVPFAAHVGETKIDVFDFLFFDAFQNVGDVFAHDDPSVSVWFA
jgi:hypothetical protein